MAFKSKQDALIACEAARIRFRTHCEANRDAQNSVCYDENLLNALSDIDAEQDGSISASCTVKPEHCNHLGLLSGGMATSLLDLINSWNSLLFTQYDDAGGKWDVASGASRSMNTSYLRSPKVGSTIRIISKPVAINRTMSYFEGYIKSLDGKTTYTAGQHHIFGLTVRGNLEERKKLLASSLKEAKEMVNTKAKL